MAKDVSKFIEGLTPKQAKFFSIWLKTGNGTKAALESYDTDDPGAAASIANENLRKLEKPVKTFLETNGVSLSYLTRILIDATQAEKRDQFSGEMYKDHKVRMEAVDRLARWLGVETKDDSSQQTNIQINFSPLEDKNDS
jgi:hypothetical protein